MEANEKREAVNKKLFKLMLVLFGLVAIGLIVIAVMPDPPPTERSLEETLYTYSKYAVRQNTKDPEFPLSANQCVISEYEENLYGLYAYVDIMDANGIKQCYDYTIEIQYDPTNETWGTKYLSIGGRQVYP